MVLDKPTLTIIIFMGISFLMAGILITGVIPQIFKSGATVEEIRAGLIKLYNETTDVIREEENKTRELIINNTLILSPSSSSIPP